MKDDVVIGLSVIAIAAVYTALVEWRADNRRDSGFLSGVSAVIFTCAATIHVFF